MHTHTGLDQRKLPKFATTLGHIFRRQKPFSRHCSQLQKSRTAPAAADDDAPPEVSGDWRAFRAGLISKSEEAQKGPTSIAEANVTLLRKQDPGLAEEPLWAHPIERPEVGSVLLASLKAPDVLNDPRMWQLVVLIVGEGEVTSGVILNRPSIANVGDLFDRSKGGLDNDMMKVASAFRDNVVYLGGMFAPNKLRTQRLLTLHQHKTLSESVELVPGVYIGGHGKGAEAVEKGELAASSFRFFSGVITWAPGQLRLEVDSGIWHPVACSRNLITKQCLKLPMPLWQEIMRLLGGRYLEMADQAQNQQ